MQTALACFLASERASNDADVQGGVRAAQAHLCDSALAGDTSAAAAPLRLRTPSLSSNKADHPTSERTSHRPSSQSREYQNARRAGERHAHEKRTREIEGAHDEKCVDGGVTRLVLRACCDGHSLATREGAMPDHWEFGLTTSNVAAPTKLPSVARSVVLPALRA